MFNRIAHRYDFLNRMLSFGIDSYWRRNVVKLLLEYQAPMILDVATGTADLAIEICRLDPVAVYGVDISEKMLEIAQKKVNKKNVHMAVHLQQADSENLPFEDHFFDAATVGFGVRNFENLQKGLAEIARVLRPGGRLVVLEFSTPRVFPLKQFYHFYFNHILPWLGGVLARDRAAYAYLPESVRHFPEGDDFENELKIAGLKPEMTLPQTFGVATIYVGRKD